MMSLVFDKIPNDCMHSFAKDFLIHENAVDCTSDPAQAIGSLLVLARQITDFCSGGGIAGF